MLNLLMFVFCLSFVNGEPECSMYNYQEKMLEKMIEVQFKVKTFTDKLDSWEKIMSEKISALDNVLQTERFLAKDYQTKVIDFRREMNETMSKWSDEVQKDTLSALNAAKTPVVYFKARDVKVNNPSAGQTVVFKTIVHQETLDNEPGYDPATGVFTVPTSGTYLFTTQLCLYSIKYVSFTISVNDKVVTAASYGEDAYSSTCAITDGSAHVQKGDKVRVNVSYTYGGNTIYSDVKSQNWSYFSGVLVHT